MATHDYVIANGTGAAVRSDLNGALAAIVSQNSSATEPSPSYAYQRWADTSAGVMKMRNGANNAWISLYELDGTFLAGDISLSAGAAATPSLFFTGDTNTGIYSPGADQLAVSTGGVQRINIEPDGDININANNVFYDATNNRLGLNTATPGYLLDVAGNARIGNAPAATNVILYINGVVNKASRIAFQESGVDKWLVGNGAASESGTFEIYDAVNGNNFVITHAGRVGIGTTASNTNGGILQLSGGITFPATAVAASDPNTLDDYEEGTWTGTDASGAGLSITFTGLKYTKIGRLVYVNASAITYPVTASTANATIGGLPFTNGADNAGVTALISTNSNASRAMVVASTATFFFFANISNTLSTNVQLSGTSIYGFSAVYQV